MAVPVITEITITKKSVSESMPDLFQIVLTLDFKSNNVSVPSQEFAVKYRTGQTFTNAIITSGTRVAMQNVINSHKKCIDNFTKPALDNAINTLQGNLNP